MLGRSLFHFTSFYFIFFVLCPNIHCNPVKTRIVEDNIECVDTQEQFIQYNWKSDPQYHLAKNSSYIPGRFESLDGEDIFYFTANDSKQAISNDFKHRPLTDKEKIYILYHNSVSPGYASQVWIKFFH